MQLDQSQQVFDNNTLDYDLKKYPFPSIILDTIQKFYPAVQSLDTIHKVVPADNVYSIRQEMSFTLLQ